jgi:hypothetical protein
MSKHDEDLVQIGNWLQRKDGEYYRKTRNLSIQEKAG